MVLIILQSEGVYGCASSFFLRFNLFIYSICFRSDHAEYTVSGHVISWDLFMYAFIIDSSSLNSPKIGFYQGNFALLTSKLIKIEV